MASESMTWPSASRDAPPCSERILQPELNLPHRERRRGDDAEALMRGVLRRPWERRARQDVSVRCAPHRNVEHVEGFDPGLDAVAIRQPEVFRQRRVDLLQMRRGHRIARDVPELAL